MRLSASLEVVGGDGRSFAIPEAQAIRVGRAPVAEISFPADSRMSAVHFSLVRRDSGYQLWDLDSTTGTFVNGRNVGHAVLADGDEIRAGQTVLRFRLPGETQAAGMAKGGNQGLKEMLAGTWQPLYALLDAARDRRVLPLLKNSGEQFQSLYEGAQGEELAEFAPYLVRLFPDSELLDELVEMGWGQSWGVFLKCCESFLEVRRHFRHFLLVKDEQGEEYYFRFYDPRVLRPLLPVLSRMEREEFFGPIEAFVMEGEDAGRLLAFLPSGESREAAVAMEAGVLA